jgi:hypothetical protein
LKDKQPSFKNRFEPAAEEKGSEITADEVPSISTLLLYSGETCFLPSPFEKRAARVGGGH